MNLINELINNLTSKTELEQSNTVCNYADNYYGDQVCISEPKNDGEG